MLQYRLLSGYLSTWRPGPIACYRKKSTYCHSAHDDEENIAALLKPPSILTAFATALSPREICETPTFSPWILRVSNSVHRVVSAR